VRLSVRPSVCQGHSGIESEPLNVSSKFFHARYRHRSNCLTTNRCYEIRTTKLQVGLKYSVILIVMLLASEQAASVFVFQGFPNSRMRVGLPVENCLAGVIQPFEFSQHLHRQNQSVWTTVWCKPHYRRSVYVEIILSVGIDLKELGGGECQLSNCF